MSTELSSEAIKKINEAATLVKSKREEAKRNAEREIIAGITAFEEFCRIGESFQYAGITMYVESIGSDQMAVFMIAAYRAENGRLERAKFGLDLLPAMKIQNVK